MLKVILDYIWNMCSNIRVYVLTKRERELTMELSLSAIRTGSGYTIDEAAKCCNTTKESMEEYEVDPGKLPASIVIILRRMYGVPIDYARV